MKIFSVNGKTTPPYILKINDRFSTASHDGIIEASLAFLKVNNGSSVGKLVSDIRQQEVQDPPIMKRRESNKASAGGGQANA